MLTKGRALLNQDKYTEAIPVFERATKRDPNKALAWTNKGVALARIPHALLLTLDLSCSS